MTVFYGDQSVYLPPHLNFGSHVVEKCLEYGDKVALIDASTHKIITYREMAQRVVNVATYLKQTGLKENDVVAICSENRIEYLVAAVAVCCSGAILTCMNSGYNQDELIHVLNISKPKYIFVSYETHERNYRYIKDLNIIEKYFIFGSKSTNTAISFDAISQKDIDVNSFVHKEISDGTALILYSSGTTGPAKGARITHKNLFSASQQPVLSTKNLIVLTTSPWSSTFGMVFTLHEIIHGRTMTFLARFNEKLFFEAIQKYKVGVLIAVPPVLIIMSKSDNAKTYDTSSLEIIYSGGATLSLAVIKDVYVEFPSVTHVIQGYGMTETTGALTGETVTEYREGSVGKVLKGIIIKVVDVETRKLLGPGQPGEVCAKGTALFNGYIGKELKEDTDEDGFYKTGDIAYYDNDGFFFMVDRIKEIIKYKGWQVSPSELEDLLLQHPAVKDVGVTGRPDSFAGELPTAFVVKKPDMNVTEAEIKDVFDKRVSTWKRLHGGVIFVNEIPKNGSGKILRRKLREMLPKLPTSKL